MVIGLRGSIGECCKFGGIQMWGRRYSRDFAAATLCLRVGGTLGVSWRARG